MARKGFWETSSRQAPRAPTSRMQSAFELQTTSQFLMNGAPIKLTENWHTLWKPGCYFNFCMIKVCKSSCQ